MRGASLAYLWAPNFAMQFLADHKGIDSAELVFSGASQGLLKLDGETQAVKRAVEDLKAELSQQGMDPEKVFDATREAVRSHDASVQVKPLAHLRFVTGLAEVEGGDETGAMEAAHARARWAQFTASEARHAPQLHSDISQRRRAVCGIDRMRVADSFVYVPSDTSNAIGEDDDYGTPCNPRMTKLEVSRSAVTRRSDRGCVTHVARTDRGCRRSWCLRSGPLPCCAGSCVLTRWTLPCDAKQPAAVRPQSDCRNGALARLLSWPRLGGTSPHG